ncbi:MAG TPA: hypothetical protein VEB42_08185, partial [Chitinophagaceae bacterium]|nr:hypothetical protein [Chitinophagaceae bacterium]
MMAISFGYASQAQSLRGKVIYISSQPVKFKFGSRITDYGFTDRTQASTLRVEVSGKKNLSINNTGNFKTVNLVVTEGANTHLFILYYVGQGNPAAGEEVYDFSTPELLKAEILEITKGRNSSPEVTDPQPQVTNIPMAVQDTAISKPVDTDQQQVVEDSSALVKDTVEIKKPVETVVDSAVKQEPVSFVNRPAVPRPENDSPVEAIAGDERANKPVVRKELPVTTASENTVVENSTPRPQSNLKTDAIAANGGA